MPNFIQAINKLAAFLGGKFDDLKSEMRDGNRKLIEEVRDSKKTIELDLTTRAIEKLQETSDLNINKIATSLEKVAKDEGARLTALTRVITQLEAAVRDETSDTEILRQALDSLKDIDATLKEILMSEASEDVCDEVRKSTATLVAAIREIELEEAELDLSPVTQALKRVSEGLSDLKATVRSTDTAPLLKELLTALKGISFKVPDTFKLDDTQFRTLRSGGSSTVMLGGGETRMNATRVETTNVALTATNTQYSYTFPANTVSWQLKLRSQGVLGYYSYTTGTLPVVGGGGDASNYITIPQNFVQSADGVEWSGKTIYLGSASASQVAEITVFKL